MKKRYLFLAILSLVFCWGIIFFEPIKTWLIALLQKTETIEKQITNNPDDPVLNYRMGTDKYKKRQFSKSRAFFRKAAEHCCVKKEKLKALSLANSGNSGFKIAQILVDKKQKRLDAKAKAIEVLTETISDYDKSLYLVPTDKRVLNNKHTAELFLQNLQKTPPQDEKSKDSGSNKSNEQEGSGDGDSNSDNKSSDRQNNDDKSSNGDKSSKAHDKKGEDSQSPEKNTTNNPGDESSAQNREDDNVENEENKENKEDRAFDKDQDSRHDNKQGGSSPQQGDMERGDEEQKASNQNLNQREDCSGQKAPSGKAEKTDAEKKSAQQAENELLADIDEDFGIKENLQALKEGETAGEQSEDKEPGILTRIIKQRSEAEFKMLDKLEASLRKEKTMKATAGNAGFSHKGW